MSEKEKTFTEALESLQKIAGTIGRQDVALEDAIKLYEQGMQEAEFCNKVLTEAEQKIVVYSEGE